MKKFLMTFFICLVLVYVFTFFGGAMLLDLSRHFNAFLVFIALILAVLISAFMAQSEKLEALEKRIRKLEDKEREQGEP